MYIYWSQNMAFMILATWLYLNAWYVVILTCLVRVMMMYCSGKGEECIPQTWDMFHEKFVYHLFIKFALTFPQVGFHGHLLELRWRPIRKSRSSSHVSRG